jgi:hypothetical protein
MELAATENSYAFHAPDLPESSADGIQLYKKKKLPRNRWVQVMILTGTCEPVGCTYSATVTVYKENTCLVLQWIHGLFKVVVVSPLR